MIIVSVAELIKYHSEVLSFKCNYLLMKCIPISHYYWLTATFPISLSSSYCYNYTLHLHNAINMEMLAEAKKCSLFYTDWVITGHQILDFKKQVSDFFNLTF